jgi:predicted transcriptional regulator
MATQRVTVELSDPVFQQLVRIAEATSQPLEVLAAQSITSNLPPCPDNAPPEMQAELLQMQTLSIDELLEIAQAQIESEQQARHTALLEKNQTDEISPEERQELSELRSSVDRLMLRKAYAWAVLRWRGHRIPSLNELPV